MPPGVLRVLDLASAAWVTNPIAIPDAPIAVARTHGNRHVFTLHFQGYGLGSLAVLSVPDGRVIRTVPVAQYPHALVISPDERRAYVASEQAFTEIDLVAGRVVRELPWSVSTLALTADGQTLFVGGEFGVAAVSVLDFSARAVTPHPTSVVVLSPDGERVYVVVPDDWNTAGPFLEPIPHEGKKVLAFDVKSLQPVGEVSIPSGGYAAVSSADGGTLYVVSARSPVTIIAIDTVRWSTRVLTTGVPSWHARRLSMNPHGLLTLSEDQRRLFIADVDRINVVDLDSGALLDVAAQSLVSGMTTSFVRRLPTLPRSVEVVEFHHQTLDHYFVTADRAEIEKLDSGEIAGWKRTGQSFDAFSPGHPGTLAFPVCRFYGLPGSGLDSHFYSGNAGECAQIRSKYSRDWAEETANAFEVIMPDLLSGQCPEGSRPIYRLWNGRRDSNHRYTTDGLLRDQMLDRGYVPEGYGASGVAMCAASN